VTVLAGLAAECADAWSLRLGEPYGGGEASWVAPAELPDGTPVVLKLNPPEPESEREGDALAFWAGEGAVRLLAEDESRRALLLERCEPGTRLWDEPDDEATLSIAAGVLRALWRPTASLLRDRRWELRADSQPEVRLRRRLDQLAAELALDRERMRGWGIAHALAWGPDEGLLACARWLAAAGPK
jgi:streptomycin 6-kinase